MKDVVVYTTINWDLQKEAEFLIKEAVATEGPNFGFTQGALVSIDADGAVRAVVGGADYQQSQYNRAVTSRRQPGSTFKPFVYMAAMEKGYTPDTLAEDAQFEYNGWSPRNSTGRYAGTVTLRQGLAYSLNTIAGRLAIDVTPEKVIEVAMRMGISSSLTPVPSIALGTQEVNLLELTSAYAPFANGGMGVIPNVITKVTDVEGKVLYEASDAGPGRDLVHRGLVVPLRAEQVVRALGDRLGQRRPSAASVRTSTARPPPPSPHRTLAGTRAPAGRGRCGGSAPWAAARRGRRAGPGRRRGRRA